MVMILPADVTHQSNTDSVVVAELAIYCYLGPDPGVRSRRNKVQSDGLESDQMRDMTSLGF